VTRLPLVSRIPTPDERATEGAIVLALSLDLAMMTAIGLVGILGGSLTMIAETIRAAAANAMEGFSLVVMRRIHRGRLADMKYGTGKLEQFANIAIALGMLGGAMWILHQAVAIVDGDEPVATPIGLAMAAIVGAVNLYLNLVSWDAIRRVVHEGDAAIMQGQLASRVVKLVSSLLVMVSLTIAALSTEEVVVEIADAAGSLVVSLVIVVTAFFILQQAVPDILDSSAGPAVEDAIGRALEEHRAGFTALRRVRSRRSGRAVFVEIALSFEGGLSHAEVERRAAALRETLRREVADADIAILIGVEPAPSGAVA
jgi:cation diffusion facilitator family transporter